MKYSTSPLAFAMYISSLVFCAPTIAQDEDDAPEAIAEPTSSTEKDGLYVGPLRIGGAFRFNYINKDWDSNYNGSGELAFETARLNLDLDADYIIGSLDYRYYHDKYSEGHDYSMLKHGWLGYRFDEEQHVEAGVTKVPFGILPYASHSWFFQLPYYVGLEDDYDLGAKYVKQTAKWNFQAAAFARDEYSYFGDSDDSARYSYDLVREGNEGNAERGQFNVRLARTIKHAENVTTEIGGSAQYGIVDNNNTSKTGENIAVAAHVNVHIDRWNIMLQAIRYEYDVHNAAGLDSSADGSFVTLGAYDASYHAASDANIYTAGISYTLPVSQRQIQSITFYNDFSYMDKQNGDFSDTFQNVIGMSIAADPFYIYIDVASGWNHPWLGGDWTDGLAAGSADPGWHTRFNINVGLYF